MRKALGLCVVALLATGCAAGHLRVARSSPATSIPSVSNSCKGLLQVIGDCPGETTTSTTPTVIVTTTVPPAATTTIPLATVPDAAGIGRLSGAQATAEDALTRAGFNYQVVPTFSQSSRCQRTLTCFRTWQRRPAQL